MGVGLDAGGIAEAAGLGLQLIVGEQAVHTPGKDEELQHLQHVLARPEVQGEVVQLAEVQFVASCKAAQCAGSTHVEQQNEQQYEACKGSVLWYAVQAKELLATAEHKVEDLEEQGELVKVKQLVAAPLVQLDEGFHEAPTAHVEAAARLLDHRAPEEVGRTRPALAALWDSRTCPAGAALCCRRCRPRSCRPPPSTK